MIPLVDRSWQSQPWQWQLAHAVSDVGELMRLVALPQLATPNRFPLLVPHAFIARMEAGNPADPLLRQVLPVAAEGVGVPGYRVDPVGDGNAVRRQGLLQKYTGRALIIVSGACAVNCRYCFRRHFPYGDFQPDSNAWDRIIADLEADPSISEVILSGGDPLILSDRRLEQILARLDAIPHVSTIRIHTRLPVVIPARVTDALTATLNSRTSKVVVILHINHAGEIDEALHDAASRLRASGALLLNQSVLLADINDSEMALAELSRRLFAIDVLPYYLHQLDPVAGAAHFEVTDARAAALIDRLRALLPGYLVPKLVREVEGAPSKTPLP